jgi:hypothetical protein
MTWISEASSATKSSPLPEQVHHLHALAGRSGLEHLAEAARLLREAHVPLVGDHRAGAWPDLAVAHVDAQQLLVLQREKGSWVSFSLNSVNKDP